MAQQNESIKAKLIKLQNLLGTETKTELTLSYLQYLLTFFRQADMSNEKLMKNQVYDQLRDTVRSIFNYLDKVKIPESDLLKDIEKNIKWLLIAICDFCSAFYFTYYPLGCGQMIKEFLSSECRLFVPEYGAAPTSMNNAQEQNNESEKQQQEQKWIWTKASTFKTKFFCSCIEVIMNNLSNMHEKFKDMKVMVIGQFLRLLYYMDDYVIQDKLISICTNYVDILQDIVTNPSKEIMKDVNKQKLEEVSQYLTKVLRYYKDDSLKKRIQLLGPRLGMTMLKMNSIEKKIVGCKIVGKFSYEMLYRSTSYLTETSYSQWVVSQHFFDLVFEDHGQTSLIKASQDTFKLLVKRGQLKKEQFQKFFDILEKADSELRRAMFRLIDPFRVDYYQIEAMLEIFKNIKNTQFYDDEFFYFVEGISRYSTETQITKLLVIVENIIQDHYNKFESYLVKRRSVECYAYVFDRLVTYKDITERINSYSKVAEDFIKDPSLNKLIMLRNLFENLSEHKMQRNSQQILCDRIIIELKFIENSIKHASQITLRDDLISTIKILLRKYDSSSNKQPFSQQTLLECVNFPEIFEQVLKLTNQHKTEQLEHLFNEMSNLSAVKDFQFSVMKSVFIRLNSNSLRAIKKEYADAIIYYATIANPNEFKGLDTLKYLIFNSKKRPIRQGACQLLVQIYTNYAEDFRQEGQVYLIEYMKCIIQLIQHKLKQFHEDQTEKYQLTALGALELMEDFMLNTEYFGVGSLKAHNSLIPTSTAILKVYNNCTMGDDVLKIFEKKIPSNKTLFEVIVDVSKQFKIGPLDMCFQYPNNIMIKYNGLTLEELKLNRQEVNAIKVPQSKVKKQPLFIDNNLSPKAQKVFTDMFYRYAPDGKMTSKQCTDYIQGVTLSYCPPYDSRINSLYAEYDTDKDGVLVLEDFLKFYQDCMLDPEKIETVEKNLANLRYRRDLKKYDQDIDFLNEELLFRYHIWSNKNIYELLFKLSSHDNLQLSSIAQQLLLRLPTYPKLIDSLTQSFHFKDKNPFEVQYLLTALQSQIANEDDFSKKLIAQKNYLAIFDYIKELNQKEEKSLNEKNCQIICLHILHSLLFTGPERKQKSQLKQFPDLAFELPPTGVFLRIIKQSIKEGDPTILEPAFSMQLTQKEMSFDWIQQAAFHKDKDIRSSACGFLYIWMLKKSEDFDIFKVPICKENNEEWFNLMTMVIHAGIKMNHSEIFSTKIKELNNQKESLESHRFNPVIQGNLKIIKELHHNLNNQQKTQLYETLSNLLPSLISNQNRSIVYELISKDFPNKMLNILSDLVNIKIGKQAQPRNKFVGIRNLGCICYMNSILQQFFMIKRFLSLIMSLKPKQQESQLDGIKLVDDFLYQLQKMYIHLEHSQKQYYDPTTFCLAVKDFQGKPINTRIQEDAHEFLNTAFDKLQNYSKSQERLKILERIFGGKTVTEIICQTCKNKNQVLEHYYHLTVEVKGMKSLKESFEKMIQPEEISDYFCVNCDKKVQKITKQALIKEAPEILVINLQRIVFDLETFLKVKVHTKLQFDQTLDLHNYFSSSSKPAPYHLKGVVIHSGTSEGGHYYSLIKQQNSWYKFNDQSVTLFNENDIGREAFGGQERYETMGDLSSSTNAYILFYERAKNTEQTEPEQLNTAVNEKLIEQVLLENKSFEKQMQLYQPSFFICLNSMFEKCIDQNIKEELQTIFDIYTKVIEHLIVNSDIKIQLINQIKENYLKLCAILPSKTKTLLSIFDKNIFGQVICTHNDVNIRQIYQKILSKSILSYLRDNNEEISENVGTILNYLFDLLDNDLVLKNIYKSYQYFDLWKQLIEEPLIKHQMLKKQCLGKFIDLLMGSESTNSTKEKKRADFSIPEAMPLIPVITGLLEYKLNFNGVRPNAKEGGTFFQLSELEYKILNQQNFYIKMMKSKLDMRLLYPIISLLSFKDEKYSKFIAELLLKALNSTDEIEDKSLVLNNLKAFLLTEDQMSLERLKWCLGIPQLDSISFGDPQFGMMVSSQSKVYSYVSSLLFAKEDKYTPFLYSLFDKRKYYNSFSAFGVSMLLELIHESTLARQYILSLPAPTYIHKCYIDWIQTYAKKVRVEQHYGLPIDKNILADKLSNLLEQYHDKVDQTQIYSDLPVNKKIIGKNAEVLLKESISTDAYRIEMWAHVTFVLPNRPYSEGNLSLPDEEFSFASTVDSINAKCFLKSNDLTIQTDLKNSGVERETTVMSFNIKNSNNLILNFKKEPFKHRIYIKSGQNIVNCPYVEGSLSQLLQIQVAPEEKQPEIQKDTFVADLSMTSAASAKPAEFDYSYMEINCKECTFLNVGRQSCQMCGNDLYK